MNIYRVILTITTIPILVACGLFEINYIHYGQEISSVADLMNMDTTKNYYITNDIDLTGTDWTPIASKNNPFIGTLDGRGKTIKGLKIDKPNDDYVGYFGAIGKEGIVKDLVIDQPTTNGKSTVGALAGDNEGTITNVRVQGGSVNGSGNNVGGMLGSNKGIIRTSSTSANVKGKNFVGGFVGVHFTGILAGLDLRSNVIEDSYATGTVTATMGIAGGFVGMNFGTIKRCYATGVNTFQALRIAKFAVYNAVSLSNPSGNSGTRSRIESCYFKANSDLDKGGVGHEPRLFGGVIQPTYAIGGVDGYMIGYTANKLTDETVMNSWDFTSVWEWKTSGEWPTLKWEEEAKRQANAGPIP